MLHLLESLAGRLRNFLWWQDIACAWRVRNECYCGEGFLCPVTHDETPKEQYFRMNRVYGFCVLCHSEHACACNPASFVPNVHDEEYDWFVDELMLNHKAIEVVFEDNVPASFVDEDGIEWELLR